MIGLLLGGAAFTFKIKHDSEAAIERVAKLEKKIAAEREAVDILNADWSLLTDPKRLKLLAERYKDQLGLDELDPTTIGRISEIPVKPPQIYSDEQDSVADLIGAQSDDDLATGTVATEVEQ